MLKSGKEADRMVGQDTVHQGIIAVIDTNALMVDFRDFISTLKPTGKTMLVLLDELTDPHNVGAIVRSAAAFGASGVLIPVHNQAPVTGAVVKSSVGMVFRIPLISIGNVNYAIDKLKEMGFWTYALSMEGKKSAEEEDFSRPTLIVVGNEGRGIRQKTFERCDDTLRIPMHPRCESLNASISTAIVMYQWSTKHKDSLEK
jgi:23S rRNA (guanosine2251-2'-O)-methyltransferase